ncbi:unnamed protein product [Alopecurus aequalis]
MKKLVDELLVYVLSLTSPIDACHAAAVSREFRAATDSDAVCRLCRFLPCTLPQFAKGELPRTPMCKKDMFRRLSGEPALLPHKMMGMQLDRATGAQRLTLSARALQISRDPVVRSYQRVREGSVPLYSKRDKRLIFSETPLFHFVEKLEIRAKIQRKVLSHNTTYVAYMVFKLAWMRNNHSAIQDAIALIGVAGNKSTRQVFMQGYIEDSDGAGGLPRKHILPGLRGHAVPTVGENVHFPRKRDGGWMEVELGEFHNGEGDGDDVVSISFVESSEGRKNGFFLWGIELRSKQH